MAAVWTEDQKKVIDIRDSDILVAAAAGSGKTAVLVERILSHIRGTDKKAPIDVDKLLVVTFTRAAAGEMRQRILSAIEDVVAGCPDDVHMRKQMTYVHNAKITTIDGFCNDIVREHFSRVDVDPGYRIGDSGELTLLRNDVLSQVMEDMYQKEDLNFKKFVDIYSGTKSDSAIEEIILKLYDFAMSYPRPKEWLKDLVKAYEGDGKEWLGLVKEQIGIIIEEICEQADIAYASAEIAGFEEYAKVIEEDINIFSGLAAMEGFDQCAEAVRNIKYTRMPTLRNLSEEDSIQKKYIMDIRNNYKKLVKKLETKYFSRNYKDICDDIIRCGRVVKTIVDIVQKFMDAFREAKADNNIMDFADIEHTALNILVDFKEDGSYERSEVALDISRDFYEVMVDEYQDSNMVQEMILKSVCGGFEKDNMFMVGDVKQSIYKFRMARPELFLDKYKKFETVKDINCAESSDRGRKIILSKNFRSRNQVIDFCNKIFNQIMVKELGGIEYDADNMLYTGFDYPKDSEEYISEVMFIDTNEEKEDVSQDLGENGENPEDIELEACMVAAKIKELVYGNSHKQPLQVYDKQSGELRNVMYKDIVILLRSMGSYAEKINDVLMREGIPVHVTLSEGYYDTFEIRAILDMLSVIDNPMQDIKLVAVLRNIFGFSENMLADIKIGSAGSFAEGFFKYTGIYEDKVSAAREKLVKYRQMRHYTSIYDLICFIFKDTYFKEFILGSKSGEKRMANIEVLLDKARVYEESMYTGLFNFVRYIEKLNKYRVEQGEAGTVAGNDNCVNMMTIHKSKGLEYPVVFLCGTGKKMNMRDSYEKIVLHHDYGIGIDYIDSESRLRYKTIIKEFMGEKIRQENIAEELRVLYVALTRAREKLIVTGVGNVSGKLDKLERLCVVSQDKFSAATISGVISYMDWILMCHIRNGMKECSSLQRISPKEIVYGRIKELKSLTDGKKALENFDTSHVYNELVRKTLNAVSRCEYAFGEECTIKSKMSISDIKHMYMKIDNEGSGELNYAQKTGGETSNSEGARRGTAYHRVFELFDYNLFIDSKKDIENMLKDMSDKGLIGGEEIKLVSAEKIEAFTKTELYKEMKTAYSEGKLYRERPFVMGIPACEIDSKYTSNELVVVQGIVDAWYYQGDKIVIVDYKTDNVDCMEKLRDLYESQLVYYGEALEKITGCNVKKRVIYSVKFNDSLII